MKRELRPHQTQAIAALRYSLATGKRRPMLHLPTGAGKTVVASAIVESARAKSKRIIFVVPAISLVDQTVRAFWSEGITEIGVMQGSHEMTDWTQPVQVASIQTLARRRIPDADLVIVDEAHQRFKHLSKWIHDPAWAAVPFIGLSATPWAKGLGKDFDDLIVAATTADLIEAGYLSKFRVFAPSHPDLSGVSTVAGDYHEGQLSAAMSEGGLVADIVTTWLQRGENRPTLVFAVDRAHAKTLERQFQEANVTTGYIDGNTPSEERERVRKRFHDGATKVVCSVGCLTTGVDWDVRCIVLARPTKSEMLFVQIIGRGLRTAAEKAECLILDHSDTHLRLGFVTDIHHSVLDTGKPKAASETERKEPLPKECPKCSNLRPPKVATCPACGFKPEVSSEIRCEDGFLEEMTPKVRKADMATKQRWYSQLLGVAEDRGYKRGWAANQYREKWGVWPRGLIEEAAEPQAEVLSWTRSRMIAYAKRREKAAKPSEVAA